jgi:hypothetical protein
VIGNRGASTAAEVNRLLEACRLILRHHPSTYSEAMLEMALGISSFHQMHLGVALRHVKSADELLLKCPGTHWERTTTRFFSCLCLLNCARFVELGRDVDVLLTDAQQRGDRFTYASIATMVGHIAALAADRPADARTLIREARETWQQKTITAPGLYATWADQIIDGYTGEHTLSMQEFERMLAEARGSLLPRVQSFRLINQSIRSRLALDQFDRGENPQTNLEIASREAKNLAGQPDPLGSGLGLALLGSAEAARGNRAGAIDCLERAIRTFEIHELEAYAATVRLRRAQLIEGDRGQDLEHEAWRRLREHGVVEPYRYADTAAHVNHLIVRPPRQWD